MDIKFQVRLGSNLKGLRKLSNLTQTNLAEIVGISRSSYTQYEVGDRLPDLATLIDLANYYHVNTDTLLNGDVIDVTNEYFISKNLSKEESVLLNLYNGLSESSKGRLIERATILKEIDTAKRQMMDSLSLPLTIQEATK